MTILYLSWLRKSFRFIGVPQHASLEIRGNFDLDFDVILEIKFVGILPLMLRKESKLELGSDLNVQCEAHWAIYRHYLLHPAAPRHRTLRNPHIIKKKYTYQDVEESKKSLIRNMNQKFQNSPFQKEIFPVLLKNFDNAKRNKLIIKTQDIDFQKLPLPELDFLRKHFDKVKNMITHTTLKENNKSSWSIFSKVQILVILGYTDNLDVKEDLKIIKELEENASAEIDVIEGDEVRDFGEWTEEINERLKKKYFYIIIFVGHSETDYKTGEAYFYISKTEFLDFSSIWYSLEQLSRKNLQLVIWNSCDTLGFQNKFYDFGIPATIMFRDLVSDPIAHKFLKQFFNYFTKGFSFYDAVEKSRRDLQGQVDPSCEILPSIFQTQDADITYPGWSFNQKIGRIWVDYGRLFLSLSLSLSFVISLVLYFFCNIRNTQPCSPLQITSPSNNQTVGYNGNIKFDILNKKNTTTNGCKYFLKLTSPNGSDDIQEITNSINNSYSVYFGVASRPVDNGTYTISTLAGKCKTLPLGEISSNENKIYLKDESFVCSSIQGFDSIYVTRKPK